MKVIGNMAEIDQKLAANRGHGPLGYQEFTLRADPVAVRVTFTEGKEFGMLDEHITEAMAPLLERPELECNAFAEINTIRSTIGRAQKSTDAIIRIHININGPKSLAQDIGQELSDKKAWLQRPLTTKFSYYNPHVIKFDDLDPQDSPQLENDASELPREKKQSVEEFQTTVAEVYQTLNRDKDLSRIEGDHRLRTHLLPYAYPPFPTTLVLILTYHQAPGTSLGLHDPKGDRSSV